MSDGVYVIGTGMIKFGKYLDSTIKDLTGQAHFNPLRFRQGPSPFAGRSQAEAAG